MKRSLIQSHRHSAERGTPRLNAQVARSRTVHDGLLALTATVIAGIPVMSSPARAGIALLMPGAQRTLPATFEAGRGAMATPHPPPRNWAPPLMDRHLSLVERFADLAVELKEAISRIEGLYDPTRLDGIGHVAKWSVSAGTASMTNVFADQWIIAASDANVDLVRSPIGLAWNAPPPQTCAAYTRRVLEGLRIVPRPLKLADCVRLHHDYVARRNMVAELPVVAAPLNVPTFAAPSPGNRLSSQDFWIAQEAKIKAIREALTASRAQMHATMP